MGAQLQPYKEQGQERLEQALDRIYELLPQGDDASMMACRYSASRAIRKDT